MLSGGIRTYQKEQVWRGMSNPIQDPSKAIASLYDPWEAILPKALKPYFVLVLVHPWIGREREQLKTFYMRFLKDHLTRASFRLNYIPVKCCHTGVIGHDLDGSSCLYRFDV